MNSIQDKINLIKQSIEDKTGMPVSAKTSDAGYVHFYIQNSDYWSISVELLELLPLSLPNKEGWIAVEEVAKLKYDLYRALEALADMYSQYCSPPAGHAFMSAGENADEVLFYHGLTKNDDGQSSEVNWDKLKEIRQSSPPVKIKQ